MHRMNRREHLLLTQKSVVEVFDLRRETKIRVRIERVRISCGSAGSSHPAAEAAAAADAECRQRADAVREHRSRFSMELAGLRTEHPDVVIDFRIDMPLAYHAIAPHRRRFQERIEAEAITKAASGGVGIGRYRRHLDAADIVVEREVPNRVVAERPSGGVLGEG